MDSTIIIMLVTLFLLLLMSSFFSSAETALTTVSKITIRTLSEEGNRRAKKVEKITNNQSKMLSAILIGNNLVNIIASALSTVLAQKMFGEFAISIATGVLTILVLIFGEITPKTLASMYSLKFALAYADIIYALMALLTPIIFIINKLANGFMRIFGIDPNKKAIALTENELRTIVEVGHEEGILENEEHNMITNVFDFGEATASDVMVPKIDMTMADINSTFDELIHIFRQEKFTRIPIYQDTPDNVIGIINMKDLLLYNQNSIFDVRHYLRQAFFTYETKKLSELMIEMKKTSVNIVIVLDEYGSTIGLITLEDLLEEIVGEIHDEYDSDEDEPIHQIGKNKYQIEGLINLEDLNDYFDIQLKSDDYDSLGGFIIEKLDRLPNVGDTIIIDHLTFRVAAMDKKRIAYVELTIANSPEQTTDTHS